MSKNDHSYCLSNPENVQEQIIWIKKNHKISNHYFLSGVRSIQKGYTFNKMPACMKAASLVAPVTFSAPDPFTIISWQFAFESVWYNAGSEKHPCRHFGQTARATDNKSSSLFPAHSTKPLVAPTVRLSYILSDSMGLKVILSSV